MSLYHRRPKNVAINFVHCKRRRQRIVYIYVYYVYYIYKQYAAAGACSARNLSRHFVYYIYKQYAAAGACSARNLSRHFWAAYDYINNIRLATLQLYIVTTTRSVRKKTS